MIELSKLSFSAKIAIGSSAIVLFVGLLSSIIASQMVAKTLVTENKQRGLALAKNLAARAVDPILARDLLRLKNLVDQSVVTEQGVEYALILDHADIVLAHSFHGGFPADLLGLHTAAHPSDAPILLLESKGEYIYDIAAPVLAAGASVGLVRLGLSRRPILEQVRRLVWAIMGTTAGVMVLAVFVSTLFAGHVTRRVDKLRGQAEDLALNYLEELETNYASPCRYLRMEQLNLGEGDEINDLSVTFDFLSQRLQCMVNELTQTQETLTMQQEQLIQAQKMESLGKLAGGVAHEINTPLGVILGYAQLLQEDAPEDSQLHEDLAIIEKQAKVCRKIVADLLGFSRQSESAKQEMCFNNSLMEAINLVKHTYSLDGVEIMTDLDDRMPVIYGDPEKLKQVWINLLHNARDAMNGAPGGILVCTRLDIKVHVIRAWVVDIGEGINQENLKKIFDPFFSTKPVNKGTGLGLSVTFGIIEDHGGTIVAQSPAPEKLHKQLLNLLPKPLPAEAQPGPGVMILVELPLEHEEAG